MRITKSVLTAAAVVALAAFNLMAMPAPKGKENKSPTHVTRDIITSIDKDRVVMAHTEKGKTEDMTFMLNSKTERKGTLTPGSQVSVHYKSENSQLLASAISGTPP